MANGDLIPTDGLLKMDMSLQPMQTVRMGVSGNSVRGVFGPTRWRLDVETRYLSTREARIWDAWLARRIHFGETFTAWRLLRQNPPGPIGTEDGSLGLTVDIPNSELDLTGTGGYVANIGDMIGYRTDVDGYYLGMATARVAASGGAANVPVIPRPLAKHATTPAVRRVQALGEFELASSTVDGFDGYTGDGGGRRLRFQAIQVLR